MLRFNTHLFWCFMVTKYLEAQTGLPQTSYRLTGKNQLCDKSFKLPKKLIV